MAVVLSARLMVRYADKYDPDLAAAFEKLEQGLPPALAEHVERTLDILSKAPRDERFSTNVRLLTKAWAERRVVTIDYEPAPLRAWRGAPPGDGSALSARAVAPDARPLPDRVRRRTRRDPHVQGRADPDRRPDAADVRAARSGRPPRAPCARRGTSSPTRNRSTSCYASPHALRPGSSKQPGIPRSPWPSTRTAHSAGAPRSQARSRSGSWILAWGDDVEVLEPQIAPGRRRRHAPPRAHPLRGRSPMKPLRLGLALSSLLAVDPRSDKRSDRDRRRNARSWLDVNARPCRSWTRAASFGLATVGPRRRARRGHGHRRMSSATASPARFGDGLERHGRSSGIGHGEVIAYSSAHGQRRRGRTSSSCGRTSPSHWALLTSGSFNYLGHRAGAVGLGPHLWLDRADRIE